MISTQDELLFINSKPNNAKTSTQILLISLTSFKYTLAFYFLLFQGGRGYESRWECYRGWWKTEGEEQESVVTSICWKAVMLCVRLEEEG
ncbi:hypothetical protein OIU77_009207 [Salix suchowensis]|uniref:Uncharacterized protein n=1 Tax=Salix suchowensis TaxID=1278906 RepID=A0ABQ9AE49_9ROSI|nr:hypothetical protein OIU77_009207 [Salix suchowensis]